jgi:hypothetical protein
MMATVVVMDPSAYAHMDHLCHLIAEQVTDEVFDDALVGCPVDEGELIASLDASVTGSDGRVSVGTDHWRFVEYGARPHIILSHGPWPLRNRKTGQVFGPIVHHPGSPEQAFMRRALRQRRVLHRPAGF